MVAYGRALALTVFGFLGVLISFADARPATGQLSELPIQRGAPPPSPAAGGRIASLGFMHQKRSGLVRLRRPLSYEVFSLTQESIDVRLSVGLQGSYRIRFLVDKGNTEGYAQGLVLTEETRTLMLGEQALRLPMSPAIRRFRGGWLLLLVQKVEAPATFDWAPVGIGLLFVTAGQSNATNYECKLCGTQPSVRSSSFVRALEDLELPPAKVIPDRSAHLQRGMMRFIRLRDRSPIVDGPFRNVWMPVGLALVRHFGVPVAFINVGWGASSIEQWNSTLLTRFSYGAGFRPTLLLWAQGEADVDSTVVNPSQAQRLTREQEGGVRRLIGRVMARIPAPWVIALSTVCAGRPRLPREAVRQAYRNIVDAGGFAHPVYLGPDTDAILHSCHFASSRSFAAQAESWTANLLANPVLQALAPAR